MGSSKHIGGELTLGPGVASIIERLWEDGGVKECFENRNRLQIPDSLGIFLDNLERITAEGFVPTDMDILLSRKETVGVVEHEFQMDDHTLVYVDVAGQRGYRRKWMHHFEQITAVIFLTAISEYNQVLWEDNNVNRIIESKQLFSDLLTNPYFLDTCFIVFFDKKDLFEEKIKHVSLKKYFPSYEGRDYNAEEAIKFIKGLFTTGERKNRIYTFDTVAINKENAAFVSRAVQDIIFNKILNQAEVV